MTSQFQKIIGGLLLVGLTSCNDDPEDILIVQPVLQFQHEQLTISEAYNAGVTVLVSLSSPSESTGTITLQLEESMQHRVQTNPKHAAGVLSLPVAKGANQLQFTVKPINNALAEGDQILTISIVESTSFRLGKQKNLQLIIEDDDVTEIEQSKASFEEQSETIMENQEESTVYKILLAPSVAVESKIVVSIHSNNMNLFNTLPASENNQITLIVPEGATEVSFSLSTINNTELTGHTAIEFSISNTAGSIIKGARLTQKVTISDDELAGKLKGYEITTSESSERRTYEYDSKGRISKVIRESQAPHHTTTQTDTYFYDAQDHLIKMNKWLGRDVVYTWSNNQIIRADVFQDGALTQYANYAYDEQGNLAGVEPFYKQPDGSFKDGGITIYLYFTDGNLYKALTYNSSPNHEALWTTQTFDQYLSDDAPIAMLEVLPNVKMQRKLVGTYRFENHSIGQDQTYSISYEFTSNGPPSKRTASTAGDTQVTQYYYY